MRTHRIGTWDLDAEKIGAELESTRSFAFAEPYQEFVAGRLSKEVMLWTPGGETGDCIIAHYDKERESAATEWGQRLPYLMDLVEQHLDLSRVRFMRLAVLSGTVLVPHRDYVEFADTATRARPAHRLHVPLATDEHCMFSEEDTVYRMKFGEVWFIDVSREHSAAVLTDKARTHLIVDFVESGDPTTLTLAGSDPQAGIPEENRVPRRPLPDSVRAALRSLGPVVDRDNLTDLLGIIAKKIFRYECGTGFFWNTVEQIARGIEDPELSAHVSGLREYFMLAREE